jgi:hypothetical protein
VWDSNVPLHEKTETRTPDYSKEKGYFDDVRTEPVVTWVFEEGTFVPAAKLTGKQQYSIVTVRSGIRGSMRMRRRGCITSVSVLFAGGGDVFESGSDRVGR